MKSSWWMHSAIIAVLGSATLAQAQSVLTCDRIVVLKEQNVKRIDAMIPKTLQQLYKGSRVCAIDHGGWSKAKLYAVAEVEYNAKELSICFDITASFPDSLKKLRQSLARNNIDRKLPEMPAASECSGGTVLKKPLPEKAVKMKLEWLASRYPAMSIVSTELVQINKNSNHLFFARLYVESERGHEEEFCVNVTKDPSTCGNSVSKALPTAGRQTLPLDLGGVVVIEK